jgi:hypothetical protein
MPAANRFRYSRTERAGSRNRYFRLGLTRIPNT